MEKHDPSLDLLPIPKGESVPVLVPVPKVWMDVFDRIAARMKVDRPTFLLQLIARLAKSIATRLGGETVAPLSQEESAGGFRTIGIAIPLVDLVPLERVAAIRGTDPTVLIGESIAIGIEAHKDFLRENPDLDEAKH